MPDPGSTKPEHDETLLADTVALAGDWEGNLIWAIQQIQQVAAHGARWIFQVGDFRVWPGEQGARYLKRIEREAAAHGIGILITPGNHEDWARLDARWSNPKNIDDQGNRRPLMLTPHIAVLPPGHRFVVETPSGATRSFVSLGGAPSIDRESRTEGINWWPSEVITEAEVARVVADGYADVMLAHDSPDGGSAAVVQVLASNPLGLSAETLAYAATGRDLMNEAFSGVRPGLFVHGHYHVFGTDVRAHSESGLGTVDPLRPDGETWFLSLPCFGEHNNTILLDIESGDLRSLT